MGDQLYSFGNTLKSFIENNRPNEAASFISEINQKLTTSELPTFIIDTYILNIFNEKAGLLTFLEIVISNSAYKTAILKSFDLLYTLVNNCYKKLSKYLLDIIKCASLAVRSSLNSSIEKQKSLDLITLIIQKGDLCCSNTEITEIYNLLYKKCLFHKCNNSQLVQEKLLITVGAICKKFPSAIEDPYELRQCLVNMLHKELYGKNPSYSFVTGIIMALSNVLEHFPITSSSDHTISNSLYQCLKLLADPGDTSRRVVFRESLSLISKHIVLFSNMLYPDAKWWHVTLLKWFHLGVEDKKVASNIFNAFYSEMANILSTHSEKNDNELFKYFTEYCIKVIMDSSLENYEIHVAIHGLGMLARAFKLHITPQEIKNYFILISQILEKKYLLNYEDNTDEVPFLPNYIQTLSRIISNLPQLNDNHIICLQRIFIFMIKIFPKLIPTQHYLVIDSFIIASYQLLRCNEKYLEIFLEDVIYQGIMWTCSHRIALEAELYKDYDKQIVTYKNYLPFWKGCLTTLNSTNYEKYEITIKIKRNIIKMFSDELVKTLFLLINKLNLNTKLKDSENPITDPKFAYEAHNVNDFVIFVNVVDFYQEILETMDKEIFKPWIIQYVNKIIIKSMKYPLVSGFYKLLATSLKKSEDLNYFDQSKLIYKEDLNACYHLILKFLQEILWKMKQYKNDLQVACLQLITSSPICVIKNLLPCAAPAFIALFNVGRSYLKLAELGIDTLNKWLKHIPINEMEPFLKQILPILDSYLQSRSLGGTLLTNVSTKTSKTKKAINKLKILHQTEPELFSLQIKILMFIGQLNNDLCLAFVNSGNNIKSVVWNKTPYLKVSLPYDKKLNLYLDKLVPRIVELALYSSDRKVRTAACELLHAVTMIMLGTCHQLQSSKLKDLDCLMKIILPSILRLGCDMDEVVEQLYSPLSLQLMHYYSHPRQMCSSHVQIVIETLTEFISNSADSSLRDFSGKCIKEFVTWTIKQADKDDLLKNPINIKLWIRTIQSFSVHPDPFKRLGGALIFNNIYVILREETHMFNMFWLELLYAFVINLSLIQINNIDDNNCVEQISQALNHIQRGLVEKNELFNESCNIRRKPPNFEGNLLKDAAMWLLKQSGSNNLYCRQTCISMFCKIAPLVKNCNNDLQTFNTMYVSADPEWISTVYEQELIKNPTLNDLLFVDSTDALFKWLQGLLCALDGYTFVITNKLIPSQHKSNNTKLFTSLLFFFEHVQLKTIQEVVKLIPESDNLIVTERDQEYFNILKSNVVNKMVTFLTTILQNDANLIYITPTLQLLWENNLWNLLCHRIFDSSLLGFDVINSDDQNQIICLLNEIHKHLQPNATYSLINFISTYIGDKLISHIDLEKNVSIKQRQLLEGMLLLQQSKLMERLSFEKFSTGTIKGIFEELIKNNNGSKIAKRLHKNAYQFCELKLQFALKDIKELPELIKVICNQDKVEDEEKGQQIVHGVYFFETFKSTIIRCILYNYLLFMEQVFKLNVLNYIVPYMDDILKYIQNNSKDVQRDIKQEIVISCVDMWDALQIQFNNNHTKILDGLRFICKLETMSSEPFYHIAQKKPTLIKWVINLLQYKELEWADEESFSFKSEVLITLPYVIGHFDTYEEDLRIVLKDLKETYFKKQSKSDSMNILLQTTFKKLLNATKKSKSNILLTYIVEIYENMPYIIKTEDLNFALKIFIKHSPITLQIKALELIYAMCFNTASNYAVAKSFIPPLLQNCSYNAFEEFYVNVINLIISVLSEKIFANFNTVQITNKTVAYIFVELLFSRIQIENFQNDSCVISKKAFPDNVPSEKKLIKCLFQNASQVCKEKYNLFNKEKEVFRVYQCHAYNAFVSIISNTQKSINFYNILFNREDNKKDVLWHSIVDINKKYTFETDFEKLPSLKKQIVNIRRDLLTWKKQADSNVHTVNYMDSQHLFKSTLNEDVTRFDFTYTSVRNDAEGYKEITETTSEFKIILEELEINEHECMSTICGLIQHLIDNDISPLPVENEEIIIPDWMKAIRNVMMTESTHPNVKIFLTKVIHNVQHIFKIYAKWFFAPIIKVIVDGCLGSKINFLITDLVVMLTSWATVAIPTEDSFLASELLKFLMFNANHDRRAIFKYNLEQIKLIIETWKSCLEIPYDLLLLKLQLNEKSQNLDVGINLIAIVLANGIAPWPETEVKIFLMTLCKALKSAHRSVYQPGAEVLGMALNYISNSANYVQHLDRFKNYLHSLLLKLKADNDKFAYCLQGLVTHYPAIADDYLQGLISNLNHVHGNFKCIYLKIFIVKIEILLNTNAFCLIDFYKLLVEENIEIQILTLEIISKSITHFEILELIKLLKSITKFVDSTFVPCRVIAYDIFMKIYSTYASRQGDNCEEILEICKNLLLDGLIDKESVIQEKILAFWANETNLPKEITKMFSFLLDRMYKDSTEEYYIGYSTYFLLNVLKSTEEYTEKLFEYALYDCNFEDYSLTSNWRRQHASIAPLFADTFASQEKTINIMNLNILRATAATLEFQPTQVSTKHFTKPPSSLSFTLQTEETESEEFKDPNKVLSNIYSYRSRRFLRDKSTISRHCAYLEVKKSLKMEEQRKERIKKSERNVTIYRQYRIGEYPDIEITLSSIIDPLQILVKCDANLARSLYTSLYTSLMMKFKDKEFVNNITLSINKIFNNSTQFVSSTIGTFLDIALAYSNSVQFGPTTIANVCQKSGLLSVGSLILEEYLTSTDDFDVSSTKKVKGIENNITLSWVKLAELYKEMNEWDFVSSIFLEKMNCNEIVLNAIKLESMGNWRSAQDCYANVIENETSQERKDFYYESYFKCFAALAEWDELSNAIEKVLVMSPKSDVYAGLLDNDWNQQNLLPWYITAELRNILSGTNNNLLTSINKCLNDREKFEYLKSNFGEELAVLCLLQNDTATANFYLNNTITSYLENWSHLNPLFGKLRANKILNCRNTIDAYLFAKFIDNIKIDSQEDLLEDFVKSWTSMSLDSTESLLLNETRMVYRNLFVSLVFNKFQNIASNDSLQNMKKECKFRLHMNLIETALHQENYYVARKYIKLCPKPSSCTISQMQWTLVLSKILFLRAQSCNSDNVEEKLKLFVQSWKQTEKVNKSLTIFENTAMCWFIKFNEHKYNLSQEIYNILTKNNNLFINVRHEVSKLMECPFNDIKDVWNFGITNLQNALVSCETEIQKMMNNDNLDVYLHIANAYVKLAYCIQNVKTLEENFIIYVLRAMKFGSLQGKQLFPCLLNRDIGISFRDTFIKERSEIPIWLFLRWLPQLLANVDTSCIFVISDILLEIAKIYPQAIMYPYRLSRKKYIFNNDNIGINGKELTKKLDALLLSDDLLKKFLKAIGNITVPTNILIYYLKKLLNACNSIDQFNIVLQKLFNHVYNETPDYKNSKSLQGIMFKRISKYEEKLKNLNKENFNPNNYRDILQMLLKEITELKYDRSTRLLDYSPWLANFHASELQTNWEIPGQYSGEKRPLVQYHVKIMGFLQTVQLMISIRGPIKITILGNDAKEYNYLIKFGEDLRQDQRILQIFNLMNNILSQDSNCKNRHLSIHTYQVVPLNDCLGMIEWVNDTKELEEFIKDGIKDEFENNAYIKTVEDYTLWMQKSLPRSLKQVTSSDPYRYACLKYTRNNVICKYNSFINSIPLDILRKSFWNISINSESFFALRQKFASSYAVICVSHWLLGIGDRHLQNTLISLLNGQAIGIDFGHAFGTATEILGVPELVPFRLTPHIMNLFQPLNEHGFLQEIMVHCLKAYKKNKDILLTTMDVFIKEPSLNWLEFAYSSEITSCNAVKKEWYPVKKMDLASKKFKGANSISIMIQELQTGHSNTGEFLNSYITVVKGDPTHNFRATKGDDLSEEDQIKCLIDHATDYNLLGRMFVGWRPWI